MHGLLRSRLSTAALVGAALLVSGCGGGDDDTADGSSAASTDQAATAAPVATAGDTVGGAPASSATDVCALLSNAQVEAAVGYPVVGAAPTDMGQGFATGTCGWDLDDGNTMEGLPDIVVSVKSPDGRFNFDILESQMPGVPNLGDAAFQQANTVWAVTGDSLVVLDYSSLNSPGADALPKVVPLVEAMLSQL